MSSGIGGSMGCAIGCSIGCSVGAGSFTQSLTSNFTDLFLANFVERFNKVDKDDEEEQNKAKLKSLIKEADHDNDGELSKDELNSVDTKNDKNKAKMVNDLLGQFKVLDKDGNGKLSLTEMQEMLKQKEFSTQELSEMLNDDKENSNCSGKMLGCPVETFMQDVLSKYKSDYSTQPNSSISIDA